MVQQSAADPLRDSSTVLVGNVEHRREAVAGMRTVGRDGHEVHVLLSETVVFLRRPDSDAMDAASAGTAMDLADMPDERPARELAGGRAAGPAVAEG